MDSCPAVLANTGSSLTILVLLGCLLVAAGGGVLLLTRGRRSAAGTALLLVIALVGAMLAVFGAGSRSASAADCPAGNATATPTAGTTGAPATVTPTPIVPTSTAATTTAFPTTTTPTSTAPTTTEPTTPAGSPDLTPAIQYGGQGAIVANSAVYVDPANPVDLIITISNVGTGPTTSAAPITFTLPSPPMGWALGFTSADTSGIGSSGAVPVSNADWTRVSAGAVETFTYIGSAQLAVGAASRLRLTLDSSGLAAGSAYTADAVIPIGAGGETNGANNEATQLLSAYPDLVTSLNFTGHGAGPDANGIYHIPVNATGFHTTPWALSVTNAGTAPVPLPTGNVQLTITFTPSVAGATITGVYSGSATSVTIDGAPIPIDNSTQFNTPAGGFVNGSGSATGAGVRARTGTTASTTPLDPSDVITAGFASLGLSGQNNSNAGTTVWTVALSATISPSTTQMDVVSHTTTIQVIFE